MPATRTLTSQDSADLPSLKRIFDDLRRGKHLAEGDGVVNSGANHLIFSILMSLGRFTGIAIIYHFYPNSGGL